MKKGQLGSCFRLHIVQRIANANEPRQNRMSLALTFVLGWPKHQLRHGDSRSAFATRFTVSLDQGGPHFLYIHGRAQLAHRLSQRPQSLLELCGEFACSGYGSDELFG